MKVVSKIGIELVTVTDKSVNSDKCLRFSSTCCSEIPEDQSAKCWNVSWSYQRCTFNRIARKIYDAPRIINWPKIPRSSQRRFNLQQCFATESMQDANSIRFGSTAARKTERRNVVANEDRLNHRLNLKRFDLVSPWSSSIKHCNESSIRDKKMRKRNMKPSAQKGRRNLQILFWKIDERRN